MNFKTVALSFLFILTAIAAIFLEQPIAVKNTSAKGFSAMNVVPHMEEMASEIHFMGTSENRKVKDYILNEFKKLEIQTEIFIGNTKSEWNTTYSRLGRTENIIATIKGTNNSKALVLCAHYDSVINGPGAADDIHAVACMIEVAKLLKAKKHKNDIIFLITDGEEMGLFGAKAYAETQDLSNIGLILNYEARGASGPSISFEWSDDNDWLVRQLKKVAKRPIASSMSYEIYKLLPNNTDYSNFKPLGIPGINHAFIDDFAYYHNPEDKPENVNLKSVQHTGENMFLLSQHFANSDLTNVKTHNASFFNFLGSLIIYPASSNKFLIIFVTLLLLVLLYKSYVTNSIKPTSVIAGFFGLFLTLFASLLVAYGIGYAVLTIYKHYNVFYSGQYYNHNWYLSAVIGSTMIVFYLGVKLLHKKISNENLRTSALMLIALFLPILFFFTPTGVYLTIFPLIALAVLLLVENFYPKLKEHKSAGILSFITGFIPIAFWVPVTYSIFLAFSLKLLPAPAIIVFLLCLSLLISLNGLIKSKVFGYAGLATLLISIIIGHITSKPTEAHPLPSSLFYFYDSSSGDQYWATDNDDLNIGNKFILKGAEPILLHENSYNKQLALATDIQPHIITARVIKDSTVNNKQKVTIVRPLETYMCRLIFKETSNLENIYINGILLGRGRPDNGMRKVDLFGMTQDTLVLEMIKKQPSIVNELKIINRYSSLPISDELPTVARRDNGYTAIAQDIRY